MFVLVVAVGGVGDVDLVLLVVVDAAAVAAVGLEVSARRMSLEEK